MATAQEIQKIRVFGSIVVSAIVLFGGGYLLTCGSVDEGSKKAVWGLIGAVVGYWVK